MPTTWKAVEASTCAALDLCQPSGLRVRATGGKFALPCCIMYTQAVLAIGVHAVLVKASAECVRPMSWHAR